MRTLKKALEVLALIIVSLGLLVGLLGNSVLKGLGYSVMMTSSQYNPAVHGMPFMANELLWLSLSWPLWLIVGTILAIAARRL